MAPLLHGLAIAAMMPAALNPALLARGEAIALTLCGSGASVKIPLGNSLPNPEGPACCSKGCRSGESRKRFDSKQ